MNQPITKTKAQLATKAGIKSTFIGIAVNACLAFVKALAGIFGNSYALIADAIESLADVFSSLIVLLGLILAVKPADRNHPYGHGKIEPLASVLVALSLIAAAILIAVESIQAINTPHQSPASFTLIVLVAVIAIKETLFRYVIKVGNEMESLVVKSDAWHHRSDAITSLAAFIGISIAIIGGPGYEMADDFAALLAAGIISINAFIVLKPALFELIDTAPDPRLLIEIRQIAESVEDVLGTDQGYVRKVGFDYYVDLDILCDPEFSIRKGHEIAHNVVDTIQGKLPQITKVLIHVEPVDDYGWRSRKQKE